MLPFDDKSLLNPQSKNGATEPLMPEQMPQRCASFNYPDDRDYFTAFKSKSVSPNTSLSTGSCNLLTDISYTEKRFSKKLADLLKMQKQAIEQKHTKL